MSTNPTSFRLPTALTVPNDIEHKGEKIPLPSQIRDNIRLLFNGVLDVHQAVVELNSKVGSIKPGTTTINNVTNVAGSVAAPATGEYFVGPGVLFPSPTVASTVCLRNFEVRVWKFSLPIQVSVANITINGEGFAGNPTVGVGIYDTSGNAIVTTTFVLTGLSPVTNAVGPVAVGPGSFFLAQSTSDSANTQIFSTQVSGQATWLGSFNATTPRLGFAANGMSVSAMPATLGAITADTSNVFPPIAAIFSN
jgi:hypothetical protein